MPQVLDLHFQGPFRLDPPARRRFAGVPVADRPGIYVWAVRQESGECLVTYVGKTGRSFRQRIGSEINDMRRGKDSLYDAALLRQGIRRRVWGGTWGPHRESVLDDAARARLQPIVEALLQTEEAYLADLPGDERLHERVEEGLTEALRAIRPPAASLLQESVRNMRFLKRRPEEAEIGVKVSAQSSRLVLPASFVA